MADGNRSMRHYDRLGAHCGLMISSIRAPELTILDCIWVTQTMWAGYPTENTTRLNQLLASADPVALDYWASKNILYPIDENMEHHPDKFEPLRTYLTDAKDVINSSGGLNSQEVTKDESKINVYSTKYGV